MSGDGAAAANEQAPDATVTDAPRFSLVQLGDASAAACEGDACLIPEAIPGR